MHGKGVYTWADGGKYDGDYQEDKKHGNGVYTFSNGKVRRGEWSQGVRVKWLD